MSALFRTSSRAVAAARPMARAFSSTPARPVAHINVVGRLAAQPELRPTSTGKEIVRYTLASSNPPSRGSDERTTSWFNVTCFEQEGPRRDYILSLPKGTQLFVSGEAVVDKYEDSEGKKHTAFKILHRQFEVLRRGAEEQHSDE
ncbi:hypothetical protein B0T26DRAFT_703633 [Lasiosphaeria miniovina]|uniref:SsDNA binding protein n=2 Tax=Lasiosphaeria TaxID=92901 RepID=A0AA40E3H0_9PEZI|nr:uncharacterized protein B0T26DRAFT_703633 [Lasiosphaeria miniovina]KAK0722706.1 hypothetical protein B0T26DRAFT_703633 [Lasiosphaeria miniovina]KAK3379608.1 hypothetical protein B0T24DRAFT_590146 [Lasiosphaeria ovina]